MSKKRAQSKTKASKKQEKNQDKGQESPQEPQHKPKNPEKFSLYALLQLQEGPKSTIDQVKKQYKKLVILFHPDKNIGDDSAKDKFQKLQEAYEILSNPERKKLYDQTGTLDGDFDEKSFETAYQYFRTLFKKIEKADIESFELRYRNSSMEHEDLLEFYEKKDGDMTTLLQCIPLSRNEDVPRFIQFFQSKILEGVCQKTKAFQKTKGKVRELQDQTEQFQQNQKEQKARFEQLALAIRAKSNKTFIDSLQEKYCKVQPKKTKAQQVKSAKQGKGRRISKK